MTSLTITKHRSLFWKQWILGFLSFGLGIYRISIWQSCPSATTNFLQEYLVLNERLLQSWLIFGFSRTNSWSREVPGIPKIALDW